MKNMKLSVTLNFWTVVHLWSYFHTNMDKQGTEEAPQPEPPQDINHARRQPARQEQ